MGGWCLCTRYSQRGVAPEGKYLVFRAKNWELSDGILSHIYLTVPGCRVDSFGLVGAARRMYSLVALGENFEMLFTFFSPLSRSKFILPFI